MAKFKGLFIKKSFGKGFIHVLKALVQAGMGIGITLWDIAGAVTRHDALGVISSAALDMMVKRLHNFDLDFRSATAHAVSLAKKMGNGGPIGINVMEALAKDLEATILGAMDGGVDVFFLGAGLHRRTPEIVKRHPRCEEVSLVIKTSSLRALKLTKSSWDKIGCRIGAVVIEGPKAGGHLGFKYEELLDGEILLENIFREIKKFSMENDNFPIIVAGGIRTNEDVHKWLVEFGADGVKSGSDFVIAKESNASPEFKQITRAPKGRIIIMDPANFPPGSPCNFPFRIFEDSPFLNPYNVVKKCSLGYVCRKNVKTGEYDVCPAPNSNKSFCICTGLRNTAFHAKSQLWTIGEPMRSGEIIPQELASREVVYAKDVIDYLLQW